MRFSIKVINLSEMRPFSDKIKAISDTYSKIERGLIIPSSNSTFYMEDSETIKNSSNYFFYKFSFIKILNQLLTEVQKYF